MSFRRLPRLRYVVAGIAIGAVAAAVSPALGVFRTSPQQPALVAGQVQHLLSVELENGKTASLWQGPTSDGGVCTLFHVAPASAAATPPTLATAGADCVAGPARAPQPAPFQTSLDWTRSDTGSGYGLIVYGHVSAASRIGRVDLSAGGTVRRLPLARGYFLVELPDVPAAGDLPGDGPYVLEGYGGDGRLVASLDLAHAVAMASPPQR